MYFGTAQLAQALWTPGSRVTRSECEPFDQSDTQVGQVARAQDQLEAEWQDRQLPHIFEESHAFMLLCMICCSLRSVESEVCVLINWLTSTISAWCAWWWGRGRDVCCKYSATSSCKTISTQCSIRYSASVSLHCWRLHCLNNFVSNLSQQFCE